MEIGEQQQPLVEPVEGWEWGASLGKGLCGVVVKANRTGESETFAVKAVDLVKMHEIFKSCGVGMEKLEEATEREIDIMKSLKHPYVIGFEDNFRIGDTIFMVMELVSGQDLLSALPPEGFREEVGKQLYFQICCALAYCHSQNVIHGDVKLENVLVRKSDQSVKLIDFGFSQVFQEDVQLEPLGGTRVYCPPHIHKIDFGWDNWAVGVLLFAMCTGSLPFSKESLDSGEDLVLNVPLDISDDVVSILAELLCPDPRRRGTVTNVLMTSRWLSMERALASKSIFPSLVKEQHFVPPELSDTLHGTKIERKPSNIPVRRSDKKTSFFQFFRRPKTLFPKSGGVRSPPRSPRSPRSPPKSPLSPLNFQGLSGGSSSSSSSILSPDSPISSPRSPFFRSFSRSPHKKPLSSRSRSSTARPCSPISSRSPSPSESPSSSPGYPRPRSATNITDKKDRVTADEGSSSPSSSSSSSAHSSSSHLSSGSTSLPTTSTKKTRKPRSRSNIEPKRIGLVNFHLDSEEEVDEGMEQEVHKAESFSISPVASSSSSSSPKTDSPTSSKKSHKKNRPRSSLGNEPLSGFFNSKFPRKQKEGEGKVLSSSQGANSDFSPKACNSLPSTESTPASSSSLQRESRPSSCYDKTPPLSGGAFAEMLAEEKGDLPSPRGGNESPMNSPMDRDRGKKKSTW
eukprot:CAMPEP_0201508496 /NCGR_PEP_ID=MMETSP0161_2-20130828/1846_1 /ASSEMBLY_ACC=CAM_ASM_000251 /TAXON_ID=180227 /ORGANISM="Neoparamoeba aestuarina, Strain SoJaBio B1-5/56/2" /LENGTH=682 /DNA_ID=CAMNT_0047903187 /DNA_START=550 /DNA_END=2595 /DNA_ORIENTATION=+